MWINVKVNTYFFFEGSLQFLLEIVNKLRYPTIIFVVFLAVAYEDVVFKSGNEACYGVY
jgi:hypothetical protein